MRELFKDTADEIRIFMVSSTDHLTPVTGATVAVSLLKKGQTSFSAGGGTVTEAGSGWYIYYATTTDTNTYGPLAVNAAATGADPFNTEYQVKYDNPYAKSTVKADEFGTSLDLTSTMKASVNAEADTALSDVGLTTTVTGRIDASVSSRLASSSITLAAGKVTVGTNDDKTGYSLTQSFPSNFAALGINASGHISRVTLVDTTTTNTDMRGTDGAITSLTGIATTTNISDLQTHGDSTWATATGFSTHSAADVWSVATRALTDKANFTLSTAGVSAVQSGLATSSALATVDGIVDSILEDTGTTLPATLTGMKNYIEADIAIDTGVTPFQMIIKQKGTETVLGTKNLYDQNGNPISSLTAFIAEQTEDV